MVKKLIKYLAKAQTIVVESLEKLGLNNQNNQLISDVFVKSVLCHMR